MCLFHVDENKRLMPLAVQLGQSPDSGPIFTPADEPWLWRTVKSHVQCADAQVQECASHLLRTHLVMETVAVAMHRQLSVAHPLHQLLAPHCRFTMAINHAARTKMLAPGGPIDKTMSVGAEGALQLCAKAWQSWSFSQYDLRADLKSRGVDDACRLPGYHYRDDALKIWDAIADFVGAVVRTFYRSNADVLADFELQAWARELADPAVGNFRGFADVNGGVNSVESLSTHPDDDNIHSQRRTFEHEQRPVRHVRVHTQCSRRHVRRAADYERPAVGTDPVRRLAVSPTPPPYRSAWCIS